MKKQLPFLESHLNYGKNNQLKVLPERLWPHKAAIPHPAHLNQISSYTERLYLTIKFVAVF